MTPLDDLVSERAALGELLALDPAARTPANYRRRDALDRKIRRWRANGTPRTKRYGKLGSLPSDSRNGSGSAASPTGDEIAVTRCEVCGEPIPAYHAGRKVRTDARHCPDGACRQRAYRERHREEVNR